MRGILVRSVASTALLILAISAGSRSDARGDDLSSAIDVRGVPRPISMGRVFFGQAGDSWWACTGDGCVKHVQSGRNPASTRLGRFEVAWIFFPTSTTGWVVGSGGSVFVTCDAGRTWRSQESGTTTDLNTIYCRTATHCIAVGRDGVAITTSDGGQKWRRLAIDSAGWLEAAFVMSENVAWIGGDSQLFRTVDGGRSWQVADLRLMGIRNIKAILFEDEKHGWVCGTSGLASSGDGGRTWTSRATGDELRALVRGEAGDLWAIGEFAANYHSLDGVTWRRSRLPDETQEPRTSSEQH